MEKLMLWQIQPVAITGPIAPIFELGLKDVCRMRSASMLLTNLLIADTSPLDVRSVGYSTSVIVSNLVSITSLMGVSRLMEASGVQVVFPVSAALLGVALILVLFLRPR
jgi:hypothetical protein